jgi:hypothetical protein
VDAPGTIANVGVDAQLDWDLTTNVVERDTMTPVPTVIWTCVTLEITTQMVTLSATNLSTPETANVTAFNGAMNLNIGIARGNANVLTELYVDDLAIATSSIGCP